jgi:alanine racemase
MPNTSRPSGVRTWLTINNQALAHNYNVFRQVIGPNVKLMAVVKSNAYGHDLFQFAKEQEKLGADWLGVDSVVEGLALRKEGLAIPILVLGYTLPENFAAALDQNLTLTISTTEGLAEVQKYPALRYHLKIDTGMHRQGFDLGGLEKIKFNPDQLTGIYTHFAAAKNPAFPQFTLKQLAQFKEAVKLVEKAGAQNLIKHAAATGGALLFPETHLDMVRIGIGLYGLWPAAEVAAALAQKISLQPVLSWQTIIGEVKNIPAGERVGYDLTEGPDPASGQKGRIAVCPIGYWHGYPRALSSIGPVIINGQRAKVLGRVSMDMIILDVSHLENVKVGDVVTLIGADRNPSTGSGQEITADDLADLAGTTSYEIVTRLNPLMKRIYV